MALLVRGTTRGLAGAQSALAEEMTTCPCGCCEGLAPFSYKLCCIGKEEKLRGSRPCLASAPRTPHAVPAAGLQTSPAAPSGMGLSLTHTDVSETSTHVSSDLSSLWGVSPQKAPSHSASAHSCQGRPSQWRHCAQLSEATEAARHVPPVGILRAHDVNAHP